MSEEINRENMNTICDHIIRALQICTVNKELWKSDKYELLRIVKTDNEDFYEKYPRLCRNVVFTDDINPLIGMIKTFAKVQNGELSFNEANKSINDALNAKYVDNVINSDKLKEERKTKMKEKIQEIK
jgi:hypothetical protein